MLERRRVLDLTDERGLLCGQILADLGADVIQVEPPGGSPARRLGPFLGDRPDPERSLWWWAYARNKRSLLLDLGTEPGRAGLRALARAADFLIESARPGALGAIGLGYHDLAGENPALVYVSITPFGQDGPKADWEATDLTVMPAGGAAGALRRRRSAARAHGRAAGLAARGGGGRARRDDRARAREGRLE